MGGEIKANLTNPQTWQRLLYMLLFAVIFYIVKILLAAVVLFQVALTLLTGGRNERALAFGAALSTYTYQIFRYLTYNSDERPFPFAEWPAAGGAEPDAGGGVTRT